MSAKRIGYLSLFIALSVIGGMIKVPSPVGSIALDSFPALVAAVWLGRNSGAVVGGIGHLMSALIGGFTLGPFHFMVAAEMVVVIWIFGWIYDHGKIKFAHIFFVIGNALLAPLPFILIMNIGFYLGLLPMLLMATIVNAILAAILIPRFEPFFKRRMNGTAY